MVEFKVKLLETSIYENLNIREAFEDLVRDIFFDPLIEKFDKEFIDPILETDPQNENQKKIFLSRAGKF